MLKTINNQDIQIELEPHKALWEWFSLFIEKGLTMWRRHWSYYLGETKIGTWCIKPKVNKGWEHKAFMMMTDFYIRY